MTTEKLSVVTEVAATPAQVYEAWLDSKLHSAMTGGQASVVARVGGRHTAWNGYIEGEIVDLQAGLRIVESWRTKDFPLDALHSRVEITFLPVAGGTRVALFQSDIPEGQAARYEIGWEQNYFAPMRDFFRKRSLGPKDSPKSSAKLERLKVRGAPKARGKAKAAGAAKARGKPEARGAAKARGKPQARGKVKARAGVKRGRSTKAGRSVKPKGRNSMKSRPALKARRRAKSGRKRPK